MSKYVWASQCEAQKKGYQPCKSGFPESLDFPLLFVQPRGMIFCLNMKLPFPTQWWWAGHC